jgi:hypothetical protein
MAVKSVIKGVHVVPMGMSNSYPIEGDDGLRLIDAGYPGKEAVVFGAIRGLGHSLDQLKHLIFTHGQPIVSDASTRFRNKWGRMQPIEGRGSG